MVAGLARLCRLYSFWCSDWRCSFLAVCGKDWCPIGLLEVHGCNKLEVTNQDLGFQREAASRDKVDGKGEVSRIVVVEKRDFSV